MSINKSDETPDPYFYLDGEDYDSPNKEEALFILAMLLVVIVAIIVLIVLVVLIIYFLINGTLLVKIGALGFGVLVGYGIYRYVNF